MERAKYWLRRVQILTILICVINLMSMYHVKWDMETLLYWDVNLTCSVHVVSMMWDESQCQWGSRDLLMRPAADLKKQFLWCEGWSWTAASCQGAYLRPLVSGSRTRGTEVAPSGSRDDLGSVWGSPCRSFHLREHKSWSSVVFLGGDQCPT